MNALHFNPYIILIKFHCSFAVFNNSMRISVIFFIPLDILFVAGTLYKYKSRRQSETHSRETLGIVTLPLLVKNCTCTFLPRMHFARARFCHTPNDPSKYRGEAATFHTSYLSARRLVAWFYSLRKHDVPASVTSALRLARNRKCIMYLSSSYTYTSELSQVNVSRGCEKLRISCGR